jgi:hypothetical protein
MSGYEETYQAAIDATDEEDLKSKIEALRANPDYRLDQVKLDKTIGEYLTAAGRLAYEDKNNAPKIEWLRKLGAGIHHIVKGYAMAGNTEAVDSYFKKFEHSPQELSEILEPCIYGYFFSKKDNLVDQLYQKYKDDYDTSLSSKIAAYYASKGNESKAATYYSLYLDKIKSDPKEQKYFLRQMSTAFAESGHNLHFKAPFEILNKYEPENSSAIAAAYARAEKTELLIDFLNQLKDKKHEKFDRICNEVFADSADGGKHQQIQEVYKKYANKDTNKAIALAYKATGDMASAKKFDLRLIINDYLDDRKKCKEPGEVQPKEYKYSWLPKFFQKGYTEKERAVNALEKALNGEAVDLESYLDTLRDGNLGKSLRTFIKNGRADYLNIKGEALAPAGQEIRTVTDFVRCLDAKVNNKPMPKLGTSFL